MLISRVSRSLIPISRLIIWSNFITCHQKETMVYKIQSPWRRNFLHHGQKFLNYWSFTFFQELFSTSRLQYFLTEYFLHFFLVNMLRRTTAMDIESGMAGNFHRFLFIQGVSSTRFPLTRVCRKLMPPMSRYDCLLIIEGVRLWRIFFNIVSRQTDRATCW